VKRIENLLSREIGLSTHSIGTSAVEAAVKARMRACGALEISEYVARLERDQGERSALVEEIVVSETWFFRDHEVFKALGRHAAGRRGSDRGLRVLSLPCATGEEAYSVSITLLEAGLRASRFSVRGVDVSERALELARGAEYGKNSFRGVSAMQQRAYFEAVADNWRVIDAAREAVSFSRGNVLDASLCAAHSCDVILCRNLLIYLDSAARTRALDNLHAWLQPDGVLFGGHAEALELMDSRFQRMAESTPFAYVKQARERPQRTARHRGGPLDVPAPPVTSARPRSQKKAAVEAPASSVDRRSKKVLASLEGATELANLGHLTEARRLCERVIAESGATPEAYYLLGIVGNAAGNRDEALACFNKAVYLDPRHHDALVHLALLHEERGEHTAAANFKRRAERARRSQAR
jgi:chemotaxis protein methyltransferase WspC